MLIHPVVKKKPTTDEKDFLKHHLNLTPLTQVLREVLPGNMSEGKILIKQTNMSEDMQQDAVDSVTQAMEKHKVPMEIAAYVKKDFDKKYNPTWHCIIGKNFGSYVNYETQGLIYLFVGQVAILLYRFS